MYLPLAAVAAATVVGHYELLRLGLRHGERPVAEPRWQIACLMGVMICCLGTLTVRRDRDYRDGVAIWQDTVARLLITRGHTLPWALHFTALDEMKRRYPHGAPLAISPTVSGAHINLAMSLHRLGRLDEAREHYVQGLGPEPESAKAHHNLANLLADLGRRNEALEHYDRALQIDPGYANAYKYAAATLYSLPPIPQGSGICRV